MANSYQTGFRTTLAAKLSPADTTATLATVPTVTTGRLLLQSGSTREWVDFTGVSGSTVTGLTRGLSQTATPSTSGTGLTWVAGTSVVLVAMHDQLIDKRQGTQVAGFTAAQRTALSIPAGQSAIVLNTDSGVLEQYIGGSWQTFATGTTPNASATVAGKVEVATSAESIAGTDTGGTGALLSVLPSDIAKNVQSGTFVYAASSGTNTYTASITPALTAYTTGMTVLIKFGNAATGASTINLNSLGAKTIKLPSGYDIISGAIPANHLGVLQYDGTNMVLLNPYNPNRVVGDGSDGAVSAGNLTITGSNNTYILKQYTTMTVGANTITTTPTGCVTHIKVQGDCSIAGSTLSYSGKGGQGGTGAAVGGSANGTDRILVGGGIPNGTTSVGSGATNELIPSLTYALSGGKQIVAAPGSGGGGVTGSVNGGHGGGCVIIEVGGNLDVTGATATFTGTAGTAGGATQGGGGGGGGGCLIILYNGTLTGSLTPTVTGGAGGAYGGGGATIYPGGGGGSVITNGSAGDSGTGVGGAGGTGTFLIAKNTYFA